MTYFRRPLAVGTKVQRHTHGRWVLEREHQVAGDDVLAEINKRGHRLDELFGVPRIAERTSVTLL